MAVTDIQETVFKLSGIPEAVKGLDSAAVATSAFAGAETAATGATGALSGALAALAATPLVAVGAALAAVVGLFGKAITAFGESDVVTVRLQRTMENLGNVFPTGDLLDFANALSRTTGIDDELIASLGGTAAQFGLVRSQIEKLLPTVLDVAQARGLDPEGVLSSILRASRGRPQGLVALGIDPSKIRGDIKNIDNLVSQLAQHFGGTAEAIRNTVPGALTALQTSVENLFEALGRIFGGTAVSFINKLVGLVDNLTDLVNTLSDRLGIPKSSATGTGSAGDLALKGDPEQTGLLGEIANNTKGLSDKLIGRVLGGPGTVAERAITWRDVPIALSV